MPVPFILTCCSDDENCVYRKHYWITVPSKTLHISWKKTSKTRIVSGCSFFFFSLFHRKVARISNDMAFSSAFKRKQKVNKQTSKLKNILLTSHHRNEPHAEYRANVDGRVKHRKEEL